MAYESPISVWWSDTKIEQLRDEYDNLIVRAVKNVCPNVDKDELIKALEYDRGQYEKGYRDGRLYQPPVLTNADRLRSMTDEELAWELCRICRMPFYTDDSEIDEYEVECFAKWLKQETEA